LEDIVKKLKKSITYDGVKEVWLTAQDTGCYGYDIGTNIVELLREIVKIKGNYKIRLGMANPNHVKENLDGLVELFKSDKMFKFLHIPVQSGNDEILRLMKRKYTVSEFRILVERFRKEIPDMSFSTDIICGFPGESDSQYKDSLELIRWLEPDVLNHSKFWARPGTPAEKMEQVDGIKIKDRSRLMADVHSWIQHSRNKKWVGKKCRVIVDEKGKDNTMIGRNESYKTVVMPVDYHIGDWVDLEIVDTIGHDLIPDVLRNDR
jgi:MiaB/RimO family radical SAM methylthiotransferase